MKTFGRTFLTLRQKTGKSRYNIARFTGLDESYLLRLETGERNNPSRDVVLMLGMALMRQSNLLEIWDIDDLLMSAEHCPLRKRGKRSGKTSMI